MARGGWVRAPSGRAGCGRRGVIIQAGVVPVADNKRCTPTVTATSVISRCDDYGATRADGGGPRKASSLTVNERCTTLGNLKTLATGDETTEGRGAKMYRKIGVLV